MCLGGGKVSEGLVGRLGRLEVLVILDWRDGPLEGTVKRGDGIACWYFKLFAERLKTPLSMTGYSASGSFPIRRARFSAKSSGEPGKAPPCVAGIRRARLGCGARNCRGFPRSQTRVAESDDPDSGFSRGARGLGCSAGLIDQSGMLQDSPGAVPEGPLAMRGRR